MRRKKLQSPLMRLTSIALRMSRGEEVNASAYIPGLPSNRRLRVDVQSIR